jgi:hypothetical protein
VPSELPYAPIESVDQYWQDFGEFVVTLTSPDRFDLFNPASLPFLTFGGEAVDVPDSYTPAWNHQYGDYSAKLSWAYSDKYATWSERNQIDDVRIFSTGQEIFIWLVLFRWPNWGAFIIREDGTLVRELMPFGPGSCGFSCGNAHRVIWWKHESSPPYTITPYVTNLDTGETVILDLPDVPPVELYPPNFLWSEIGPDGNLTEQTYFFDPEQLPDLVADDSLADVAGLQLTGKDEWISGRVRIASEA